MLGEINMEENNGNEEENDGNQQRDSSGNTFYGSGGDRYDGISIDINGNPVDTNIHIGPYNDVNQFLEIQEWRAELKEDQWTNRIAPQIWIENLISSILSLLGEGPLKWLNSHLTDTRARAIGLAYATVYVVGLFYAIFTYILPNFSIFLRIATQNYLILLLAVLPIAALSAIPTYTIVNYQDLYAKYTCEECGPFKYRRKARRVSGENIWFSDYICTESGDHRYTVEDIGHRY